MYSANTLKLFFLSFLIIFISACSDSTPEKYILSLSNDLESKSIDVNRTISMKVYAHYSDNTKSDVTSTLVWRSSDPSVATVSAGLISTTDKLGSTIISYETPQRDTEGMPLYKGSETIVVEKLLLSAISLAPSSLSIYEGATASVVATGTFVNPTTSEVSYQNITNDCVWSSADGSIATAEKGVIKALKEGNTTVDASSTALVASLGVEVKKIHITKIELSSAKKEFNVEQTIALEVTATLDTGEKVLLDSSEVVFTSDDTSIVSMSANIAKAVAKGSVIINAKLRLDSSYSDTLILSVIKDEYVRLFKGDTEVDFSYSDTTLYKVLPDNLDVFTLRAIGKDSSIYSLKVTDFDGNLISENVASFENLEKNEILYKDTNRTFKLIHNGAEKKLEYSFRLESIAGSSFSQRYEEID
jgi:hypothetical protein